MVLAARFAAAGSGVWLDVPFVRQVENGCGSAALAMTFRYWLKHGAAVRAEDADPDRIQDQLYSADARGISAVAMRSYLEGHGFQVIVFRGRWADLGEHLAKGRPLIVSLRSGGESHFVVVAGIGESEIEVNDPADRKLRKTDRAEFEKKWRAAGNWTLLAVPRTLS